MEYKVCVRCFTYNQSKYITETMDGFVMQQTDFPFVCCIVDDASTDGEQEVIANYLDNHFVADDDVSYEKETDYARIRFARHKDNQNCYFAVLFLKVNHYQNKKAKYQYLNEWQQGAPYQALCEGDDYWIAPNKLQKQVSFLDAHPDYSLTYCDEVMVGPDSESIQRRKPKRYSGDCRKNLIENNFIVTACVCFRYEFYEEWRAIRHQVPFSMKLGDKPQWIFLSTKGKFQYIDEPMVAYRLLPESSCHSKDFRRAQDFYDNSEKITLSFNELLHIGVSEELIMRNASLNRARISAQYSIAEMLATYKKELSRFPSLAFNLRLQLLFILRLFDNLCSSFLYNFFFSIGSGTRIGKRRVIGSLHPVFCWDCMPLERP